MGYTNIYIWSAIDRVGTAGISFLCNLILARMLSTDDFGLVGMVGIFFSIAYGFSDCGLSDGLIKMEHPKKKDFGTVLTFNVTVGCFITVLFFLIAPLIANFFNQERLVTVIRLLGLSLLCYTFTFTEETRLRKKLRMKTLAIVKISAAILASTCAILLAINGMSYLALVYLQVLTPVFILLGFFIISHWRPFFYFDKATFHSLFGFGQHLLVTFLINQISKNLNSFVLGRTCAPTTVGVYSQAQKLQETPMTIIDSIFCNTSYPVLSNISEADKKSRFVRQLFSKILTINIILLVVLFILAPFLIKFLYGNKWIASIPIYQYLLVVGFLTSIRNFIQTLIKSYGASKRIKQLSIVEISMQLLLVAIVYVSVSYLNLSVSIVTLIILSQITTMGLSVLLHSYFFLSIKRHNLHGQL